MKHAIILAVLLLSGCRLEPSDTAGDGAAAHADSVTELSTTLNPKQSDSSAKVAAVMADNGITLPQVAAYLNTYGYDVVSRAQTRRLHWRAAPPGRDAQGNVVPVAYYVAAVRIAVGDTALTVYAPAGVGEIAAKVKAYDGRGMTGPWSESAVSGPGALLPGVVE